MLLVLRGCYVGRYYLRTGSSDVALLYNDKAVLENYHVSATFRLVRDDSNNILISLSKEDYKWVMSDFYAMRCLQL